MPRGELVGEAFIRVTADTTAARRAIKRQGKEAGAEYTSAFGQEVERTADREFAGARAKIAKAIAIGDFSAFQEAGESVDQTAKKVRDAIDALRQLEKGTASSAKEWDVFRNSVDKWARSARIEETAKADADALRKMQTEAIALNKRFDEINKAHTSALREDIRRTTTEIQRAHGEALKLHKVFTDEDFDFSLRDAALAAARLNAALKKTGSIRFGASKGFQEARVDVEKLRQGLRGADALTFKIAKSTDNVTRGLGRTAKAGDGVFSIFGGINKTLEGMAHRGNPLVDIFVAPLRAGSALGKLFENLFGKQFAKIAGGSRVLGLFGGLAGSIGAAAVAVGVMVKASSLLASALSLVGSMATIAASALGGALVGGVALLAGTVPAAVAALGGIILFFKDFEKQAPKATEAAKKFGKNFQEAFDKKAFAGMDAAITTTLKKLEPLSKAFAEGLGDGINKGLGTFIALLNDPKMKGALDSLLTIPGQVNRLLNIAANAAFGTLGIFRALSPFITTFLDKVSLLTTRFNEWANSTKGQSELTKFFQRVVPMAESLTRTLGSVARAIGGIFNAAADGGTAQKFLGFLERITKGFADFVNSTDGQNKIKDWLDAGYKAGQALGTLIQGIAAIFGALDTSKSRDQITRLTDGIGNFLVRHAPDLEKFVGFIDKIGDSFGKIDLGPFIELGGIIGNFIGDVSGLLEDDALGAIDQKFEGFQELSDTLKNDLNPALKDFLDVIKPIVTWVASSSLKNLASSFQGVAQIIDGVTESLAGFLEIVTGVLTLDLDKIQEGWKKEFEGSGKILFGAFEAGFSGSGVKGIMDKAFGLDSVGASFDTLQTQTSDFFRDFNKDASGAAEGSDKVLDDFFSNIGKSLDDTRLSVGQWFDDMFSAPDIDFSGVSQKLDDLGNTISTTFENARLAVGQWFDDTFSGPDVDFSRITGWMTEFGDIVINGLDTARLAVGQWFDDAFSAPEIDTSGIQSFFTDLPNKIAYWLGAAAGSIVNFFYEQATAVITQWQEVVLPFFQNLPETLGSIFETAEDAIGNWFSEQWNTVFAFFETTAIPWVTAIPGRINDIIGNAEDAILNWFSDQWNNIFAYFETTVIPWVVALPGRINEVIGAAEDAILNWFRGMWDSVFAYFETTVVPWVGQIPERLGAAVEAAENFLGTWISELWNGAFSFVENTIIPFFRNLPGTLQEAIMSRVTGLRDWFAAMFSNLQQWWSGVAAPWIRNLPSTVASAFRGIATNIGNFVAEQMKGVINGLISQINSFVSGFNDFSPVDLPFLRYLAAGGIVGGPTMIRPGVIAGEAGREAVIPLDRPLSQIDASVRSLAAIAQGRGSFTTGPMQGSKQLVIADGAIRVTSPFADPRHVARSVLDEITEEAFI